MNFVRDFLISIAILMAATPAFGQRPPRGGPDGEPPDRPGFGGPRLDELKDALDASDEQWGLLQAKIQKILQLRRDVFGSGGGMGGPGGPPPGGGFGPGGPDHGPPGGPGADDDASPDGPPPPPATRPAHGSPTTRPAHSPPLGGFAEHRSHDDQHRGEPGPGPGGNGPHRSEVQDKLDDLSDALDTNAKPDEIKAKIEALHQARGKAHAELDKAQEELSGMINARQQAVLITMGVLD